MKLYHCDVGIPTQYLYRIPNKLFITSFTTHALSRCEFYDVDLFYSIVGKIVEVEVNDNDFISKLLVRANYSKRNDICVALGYYQESDQQFFDSVRFGFVKTIWLTSKNSCVSGLNRSKYSIAQEK